MYYFIKSLRCFALPAVFFILSAACSKKGEPAPPENNAQPLISSIRIDRSQKFQKIDGFGFFGAKDVWWGDAKNLYSDAWATQVINDLGISIWRTELPPPATPGAPQDSDWEKQRPTIEGLKKTADANRVPLKFIFSVWSPPADFKCAMDDDNNAIPGTPNPGETKQGGTLNPNKYAAFGNWLADGIQLFKNSGIDVYALSPQNEPLFKEPYNSCVYRPTDLYPNMIKAVVPIVKARFPTVKIFGSENMLEMEGGKDRQYFYNAALINDNAAIQYVDIMAVHGYSDGISPTGTSQLAKLWTTTSTEHAIPKEKPYWMTETSGYGENWLGNTTNKSGAFNLAMDIHSALVFGNVNAWIWWQGSQSDGIGEYNLMKGTEAKGKKYYASKHYYRFIRPGAVRVKLTTDETAGIFGSAYENTAMNSFTIVLMNNSNKEVKVNLEGNDVPGSFDYYITTSSSADNCTKKSSPVSKNEIVLPAYSLVTLVNGNVIE